MPPSRRFGRWPPTWSRVRREGRGLVPAVLRAEGETWPALVSSTSSNSTSGRRGCSLASTGPAPTPRSLRSQASPSIRCARSWPRCSVSRFSSVARPEREALTSWQRIDRQVDWPRPNSFRFWGSKNARCFTGALGSLTTTDGQFRYPAGGCLMMLAFRFTSRSLVCTDCLRWAF